MSLKKLSVTILSGFIGARKTTLLNHISYNKEDHKAPVKSNLKSRMLGLVLVSFLLKIAL